MQGTKTYYLIRKGGEFSIVEDVRGSRVSPPSLDQVPGGDEVAMDADAIVAIEVPLSADAVFTILKNRGYPQSGSIQPSS